MPTSTYTRAVLLLCALTLAPAAALALPKMEAGVGVGTAALPTYRGSDHYGVVALPLPYFIYRGDRIRLTRQGLRARLFDLDHFNLGLSAAFTVPGHGGDDPARIGMPSLRSTLELGPSFDWNYVEGDYAWCLCVPVRSVTATNLRHFNPAGWTSHPHLKLEHFVYSERRFLVESVSFGPVFADHKYHAYFYDVAPQYATAERPAYQTRGGYSGFRGSLFLGARQGKWSGGIGVIGDWLGGAVFADSPLVKTKGAATFGLGFAYSLWSKGSADVVEDATP